MTKSAQNPSPHRPPTGRPETAKPNLEQSELDQEFNRKQPRRMDSALSEELAEMEQRLKRHEQRSVKTGRIK